jgi:hypothetical protein
MSGPAPAPTVASAPKVSAASGASRLLQRKCACGGGASVLTADCDECSGKRLQRKLAVGASSDPFEAEADRVADLVMARRAPGAVEAAPVRVQRVGGAAMGGVASAAPPSVERVLASSGRALEPSLRTDMEQRFGHDFSGVRIHHDAAAEASAREVNAKAYTVGRDIVFGAGSYSPRTDSGRRLLAHELAHTMQQGAHDRRLQRAPAGGCAEYWELFSDTMEDASRAGVHAHDQIQAKYFPRLDIEATLPRGTKDIKGKKCPEKKRKLGELDLWKTVGRGSPQIGEIKSVNSEETGREEVQHYLLRYRQLVERLTGGGCYESIGDQDDREFVSKWLGRRIKDGPLPDAEPLNSIVPTTKTRVGVFKGNPRKALYCKRVAGGAVVYWCNKQNRRNEDEEDNERPKEKRAEDSKSKRADKTDSKPADSPFLDPMLIFTSVGLGTAAILAKYASKPVTPKTTGPAPAAPKPPAKTQGPVSTAKPQPSTAKPAAPTPKPATPAPRAGAYKVNAPVRVGTPPRVRTPAPRIRAPRVPRVPPPRVSPGGGMRAPGSGGGMGGALGVIGLALSAWGAWKTYSGAKDQIDALAGPYNAYWDEIEKLLKSNRGSPNKDVAAAPPAPAPAPRPAPAPEPEPPKKETKIHLFDAKRNTFTEKDVTVASSSLNVTYFPVTFYSLTAPGESSFAINKSQVDCARLASGTAGISGIREYRGYASARDRTELNGILAKQLALARAGCIGRIPQPSKPDGDQVTATLSAEGDSVSATCTTLVGAQANCTSEGDFKAMEALIDDPDFPPDFLLEVAVTRTRGAKTQESYATVSAWVDEFDLLDWIVDGSIPADVSGQNYASSSDLAFLLDLYAHMKKP